MSHHHGDSSRMQGEREGGTAAARIFMFRDCGRYIYIVLSRENDLRVLLLNILITAGILLLYLMRTLCSKR